MKPFSDFSGKRFGKLTAQWPVGRVTMVAGKSVVCWLVMCDCGKLVIMRIGNLLSGNSLTCGCSHGVARTHGQTLKHQQTTEYTAYINAMGRCRNPKNNRFKTYGARGIEFRFSSFEEFLAEVGPRPQGKVLDRKDNDGHYEKGNLHWVTRLESARNTTRTLKETE